MALVFDADLAVAASVVAVKPGEADTCRHQGTTIRYSKGVAIRVMDCMPFKHPNEQEINTVVDYVTSVKGAE